MVSHLFLNIHELDFNKVSKKIRWSLDSGTFVACHHWLSGNLKSKNYHISQNCTCVPDLSGLGTARYSTMHPTLRQNCSASGERYILQSIFSKPRLCTCLNFMFTFTCSKSEHNEAERYANLWVTHLMTQCFINSDCLKTNEMSLTYSSVLIILFVETWMNPSLAVMYFISSLVTTL